MVTLFGGDFVIWHAVGFRCGVDAIHQMSFYVLLFWFDAYLW